MAKRSFAAWEGAATPAIVKAPVRKPLNTSGKLRVARAHLRKEDRRPASGCTLQLIDPNNPRGRAHDQSAAHQSCARGHVSGQKVRGWGATDPKRIDAKMATRPKSASSSFCQTSEGQAREPTGWSRGCCALPRSETAWLARAAPHGQRRTLAYELRIRPSELPPKVRNPAVMQRDDTAPAARKAM